MPKPAGRAVSLNSPSPSSTPASTPTASRHKPSKSSSSSQHLLRSPSPSPSLPPEPQHASALRSLLLTHRSLRSQFHSHVHTHPAGLPLARSILALRSEILLLVPSPLSQSHERALLSYPSPQPFHRPPPGVYLPHRTRLLFRLQDLLARLQDWKDGLKEVVVRMHECVDEVERLVLDVSKRQGIDRAFREPVWTTWSLARFLEGLRHVDGHWQRELISLLKCLAVVCDPFSSITSCDDKTETAERAAATKATQLAIKTWEDNPSLPGERADGFAVFAGWTVAEGLAGAGGEEWWEGVSEVEVRGWERERGFRKGR